MKTSTVRRSIVKGLGFGLTSGTITTLGVMIGLSSGTESRLAVMGGILTVAVADAFSDAFGTLMFEKSGNDRSLKEVWESAIATFFGKLIFASTFFLPVVLLELQTAVYVSIAWGIFLLGALSYWMALDQKRPALRLVGEHWLIAVVVIVVSHFLGQWINVTFNGG